MRERYATSKLKIWVECVSESRQRLGIKGFYAIKKGTPLYESARALYDDRTGQSPATKKRGKKQVGGKKVRTNLKSSKSRKATKARRQVAKKQTPKAAAQREHLAPTNTPTAPKNAKS